MSIQRIQQLHAATQNVGLIFTANLATTPIQGNCLLMYLGSQNGLTSMTVTQGGSGAQWQLIDSYIVSRKNIYTFALHNIPVNSNTSITLSVNGITSNLASIIEEVSGISTLITLDKVSHNTGIGSTQFFTGFTTTTTHNSEYWVNAYYYDNLYGSSVGTSPTNSYIIFGTPNTTYNPVESTSGGWVGGRTVIVMTDEGWGLFMGYQTVNSKSVAGGRVTDANYVINGGNANYSAAALTFVGA